MNVDLRKQVEGIEDDFMGLDISILMMIVLIVTYNRHKHLVSK